MIEQTIDDETKELMKQMAGFTSEELDEFISGLRKASLDAFLKDTIEYIDNFHSNEGNINVVPHGVEYLMANIIQILCPEKNVAMFMAKINLQVLLNESTKSKNKSEDVDLSYLG